MNKPIIKILVTGSEGFIGKNLICHLKEDRISIAMDLIKV